MKKIAVLISGQIRIDDKSLIFFEQLRKSLSNFELIIVSSLWENQNNLELFKKKFNIKYIKLIKEKDWTNEISKVKYVTWEENTAYKVPNIFHMWHSITENINFLIEITEKKQIKFDYVIRFRTDVMCTKGLDNLKSQINKLRENEVLFPSNLHWRGLNDTFFISKYLTFIKFQEILSFIVNFIEKEKLFNPEYILYCFINELKIKFILIKDFNLSLIRVFDSKPTKTVHIPFRDKLNIKIAKQKIKLYRFLNKFNKL